MQYHREYFKTVDEIVRFLNTYKGVHVTSIFPDAKFGDGYFMVYRYPEKIQLEKNFR